MPLSIVVHGGAGALRADDDEAALREGCLLAARAGHAVLRRGGSAVEAVEQAVRLLEDDPLFNAGTGSCLNWEGEVEMDAAIMDGATLSAGAVALVRGIRNPVTLARAVMTHTPNVFLAGEGALQLARSLGLEEKAPDALITPKARARWQSARARRDEAAIISPEGGTVGAVACDAAGHVAAATSTGGMILKRVGRIGDAPLVGCGTYADDGAGAASATGHGEAIIRLTLTRTVCERIASGLPVQQAAEAAIASLERVRGEAGVIAVDAAGRLGMAFNTQRMARAWVDANGEEGAALRP